jgi:hypothetical protein
MKVSKDDGSAVVRTALSLTASGGNNDMALIANDTEGYYDLELTQSQLNFLGRMELSFSDPDVHCPVFKEFLVVPLNVYNSIVAGSATLESDVVMVHGTALSETVGGYLSAGIVKQYDVAKPVFTSASINQTADVKTVTDIISSSKIAASMDAMSDIDFGAKMKVSLNASTPISVGKVTGNVDGSVDSVTKAVTITSNADITSILADTNELQGLIADSKIASQVKGMDADVITASALKTDAVAEITAAIWAKIVDGTITFEKMSKLIVAFIAGNYTWDGSVMTVKDQAGATLFTMTITDTTGTGVIS